MHLSKPSLNPWWWFKDTGVGQTICYYSELYSETSITEMDYEIIPSTFRRENKRGEFFIPVKYSSSWDSLSLVLIKSLFSASNSSFVLVNWLWNINTFK